MNLSIIITCYNHQDFLLESVNSALSQTEGNKEIIIIDNASKDESRDVITRLKSEHPELKTILLNDKVAYPKAFNQGFRKSNGKYLIDLSGDDKLMPDFAKKCIEVLEKAENEYGVCYTNAQYIDERGKALKVHFGSKGKYNLKPPSGDIYKLLLERHIISTPTMLFKREVLDEMGGYDESLSYEDFDFWVRSSRKWKYQYLNIEGVQVRRHSGNLGSSFYQKYSSEMLSSTLKVCLKAKDLNQNERENEALAIRASYHLRQAVFTEQFSLAKKFFDLIKEVANPGIQDRFFLLLANLQLPVYPFYRLYIQDH